MTSHYRDMHYSFHMQNLPEHYIKSLETSSERYSGKRARIVLGGLWHSIGVFQTTCQLPNIATLSVWKEKCGCFTFRLTCEKFFVVHDRAEFHMPLFGSRSTNLRRDKQNNMTFFTSILFRKNIEKRKRENVKYKPS